MLRGILRQVGLQWFVEYERKGQKMRARTSWRDVRPTSLLAEGTPVEFELSNDLAKNVRKPVLVAAPPDQQQPGHTQYQQQPLPAAQLDQLDIPQQQPAPSDFVNPYNFLPAIDREAISGPLADHLPIGHLRFYDHCFTGVIRVTLKTETPLLIPDAAHCEENDDSHKTFPVRVGPDGKPYLATTSVKGMLRSAYEAITNSRLGIFPGALPDKDLQASGHGARLAFRLPAKAGLRAVPARVVLKDGKLKLALFPGSSGIGKNGEPFTEDPRDWSARDPMYAAWVHWYGFRHSNNAFRHGDPVWAYITPWLHQRPNFYFWNVEEIRSWKLPKPEDEPVSRRSAWNKGRPADWSEPGWVYGYLCRTERNIDGKHDERVFFSNRDPEILVELGDLAEQWRQLITNYQEAHEAELAQRITRPPALADFCRFSRHITHDLRTLAREDASLDDGTLCYAEVVVEDGVLKPQALYPVMISRKLYERSPLESLPSSLQPAKEYTKLSPADRVFGWVHQKGQGAHRGQLRIGPVRVKEEPQGGALRDFTTNGYPLGLPLAILGQPKPQQVRFYLGDQEGRAQGNWLNKQDAGYDGSKKLRGRKYYPHHLRQAANHWELPADGSLDTADSGVFREYLRHPQSEKIRDSQNRSILGWVNPETTFEFDLHVTNLSKVELGALVWLLELPERHFHRLGLGKPLGFGSVRLEIKENKVFDAEVWRKTYSTLDELELVNLKADLEGAKEEFVLQLGEAYSKNADRILNAFKVAAFGVHSLPVHYPRVRDEGTTGPERPNANGNGYEWFAANDAEKKIALPELTEGVPGLPILLRRRGRQ